MTRATWNRVVLAEGEGNRDAARAYEAPKEAAGEIAGHLAFWRGIEVES